MSVPLVPPIYPAAVYTFPDLDALDAVYDGSAPGYVYARDGHPNATLLADELTHLEGGNWGLVCGSGMGAITAALVPLLAAGGRVVASDRLYGRTNLLLRDMARFGVTTTPVDITDLGAVAAALAAGPCQVLFAETLSNPLCRVADVPALAGLAHNAGAGFVVDNTFATPLVCRPLAHGADLVIESLTKMLGGHSDLTLGFVAGTDRTLGPPAAAAASSWGLSAPPFDCWLARRGLATFDLRATAAVRSAAAVADWLADRPGVRRVVYPGRIDHPDHAAAGRLFPNGPGHMLCFELDGRDAVNRFMRSAPGIPFSPSLGDVRTTCSHPDTTSHRRESPAEKQRQGITPGLVRLSVGCEPVAQTLAELGRGLG